MQSKNEILRHEQSNILDHTIVSDGETFLDQTVVFRMLHNFHIDREHSKTQTTTSFQRIKWIGEKIMTDFFEFRFNGKVKSASDVFDMEPQERGELEKWSKNWQPKISEEEIFQIYGQPCLALTMPSRSLLFFALVCTSSHYTLNLILLL